MNATNPQPQAPQPQTRQSAPPQLSPQRLQGSEFARTVWVCTVEHGISREQYLQPAFWALCAPRLKPYDHIEVRSDDGTFWGELLVLDSGRTWARVHEMRHISLTTTDVSQSQASASVLIDDLEYDIRYRGPHAKWSVVRTSDAAVLKDGMQTKDEAEMFRREYLRTMTV